MAYGDPQTERIEALIAPTVEGLGYDLVRVRLSGRAPSRQLQVLAERPDGTMDIEDCAELSRAIAAVLDVEDAVAGQYLLEVSSPGVDRPLVRARDFERHVGYDARIELRVPQDGRRRFKGRIAGVGEGTVELDMSASGAGTAHLALGEIQDAKLIVSDEMLRQSLKQAEARKKAGG